MFGTQDEPRNLVMFSVLSSVSPQRRRVQVLRLSWSSDLLFDASDQYQVNMLVAVWELGQGKCGVGGGQ